MTPTNPPQDWREEFDKLFYQKDRVWMSRGGESYDSNTPEMGRGELFRFIAETLSLHEKRWKEELREKIGEMKMKMPERGDYSPAEGTSVAYDDTVIERHAYNSALIDLLPL